jgi:tricorn protease
VSAALAMCMFGAGVAAADTQPHAGMMRFGDISATHIVFSYANDLWLAPREGGIATPLASPPGVERMPRFSPDGKTIAFVGNYDGDDDIYTIPVEGGPAFRVTYYPGTEMLCDWTPDGKNLIYFSPGMAPMPRQTALWTVPATGGLPTQLPVPYGANAAISEDGTWLAYTPHTIDNRTWKRYMGGMQTDIWLFNLKTRSESRQVTDWEGTDSQPMWHNGILYYMSDAGPEHRNNIWRYAPKTGERKQLTTFADYDIKWPAMGPGPNGEGEIILQNGSRLYRVALDTGAATPIHITILGDRPKVRPTRVDAGKTISNRELSATGKRVVVEARGDIWTLPARNGTPRNLTATSGIAERDPMWSPDGKTIAYLSDQTGEYEIYVRSADGKGEARALTSGSATYYYLLSFSPDSKLLAYADKAGNYYVIAVDNGRVRKIGTDPSASFANVTWSPDSRWVAWSMEAPSELNALWVYDLQNDRATQITNGMFNDFSPAFDRKGDFLYFVSNRKIESPQYDDFGTNWAYRNTAVVLAAPLRADVKLPWGPKSDEEGDKDDAKKDSKKDEKKSGGKDGDKSNGKKSDDAKSDDDADEKDEKDKKKVDPVNIDLENFEARVVMTPIAAGRFGRLAVADSGALIYTRRRDDGKQVIQCWDPTDEKKDEKTVIAEVSGWWMSGDGKKLLVSKDSKMAVVDAKPDQKFEHPINTSDCFVTIDPRAEWKQMLYEAYRLQRDFFYDAGMHQVDWNKVHDHYAAMLDDCFSRDDVTFLIQEMISELNVGHAYYRVPPSEEGANVAVGLLGCDYEFVDGAYRIKRIYRGGAWDIDARVPLTQPGVNVKEGDYLLAINGVPLTADRSPFAAAMGLANKTVTITVSSKPKLDDSAKDYVVTMLRSEVDARFRDWIETKRKYVEEESGGKVGYIYVKNTGVDGQDDLVRQFFSQRKMPALIIDERWNGGGQIPTRFIELLNRPVTNYWARRDGRDWTWPPDAHHGPKCMLVNGLAGSGGDAFPYYFRQAKLGKLIGTRTWGGLVGISGNPNLIDGSSMTVPTFGFYEVDGTWGIEGRGVTPDLIVIDDPALMQNGADPQLDAAINQMLTELKDCTPPPSRPQGPDRKGMGIPESDY